MIGKSKPTDQDSTRSLPAWWRPARKLVLLTACALPAALLLGCQQRDEKIVHYKAPHAVEVDDDAGAAANVRLLVGMVPHADRTWFFKLQGPTDLVAKHQAEFDGFLSSIHFTDGGAEPMTWKAPGGWDRDDADSAQRYATFQVGPKTDAVQLTVTKFPGNVGGLLMNVNRWRKQIGLHPTNAARLDKCVKDITVDGAPAWFVDLTGPGSAAKSGMPPFMQGHPAIGNLPPIGGDMRPAADTGLPAGWEELANPGDVALKKFRVRIGAQSAEVSITPLHGNAGGLLANINRWRAQVGLAMVTQEQSDRDLHQIEAGGKTAPYVDLIGKDQRMLVAIVTRADVTWFVKMLGPKNLVAKQKPDFEAFVKSLPFDAGDSHE